MFKKILSKPQKPTKFVLSERCAYYNFDYVSSCVDLGVFLEWCKKAPPKQAKNITIGLNESVLYGVVYTAIQLKWEIKVPNTDYDKQLKLYNKDLAKWRKQCQQ